jgi:Uma2 family endonuclease
MGVVLPPDKRELSPAPEARPNRRLWTRDEYHRLGELGLIGPREHVELLNGEIFNKMSPQGTPHTLATLRTERTLAKAFPEGAHIRSQMPVVMNNGSELEPDVVVVRGDIDDYPDRQPEPDDVLLLVEVSDSSLGFDRGEKALAYAASGIDDYWIINLPKRQVEVYRKPDAHAGYQSLLICSEGELVAPLSSPRTEISVADLLPLQNNRIGI